MMVPFVKKGKGENIKRNDAAFNTLKFFFTFFSMEVLVRQKLSCPHMS